MEAGQGKNKNATRGGKLFFTDLDLKEGRGRSATVSQVPSTIPQYASGIGFDFEDDDAADTSDLMQTLHTEMSPAPQVSSPKIDASSPAATALQTEFIPPPEAGLREEGLSAESLQGDDEEMLGDEDLLTDAYGKKQAAPPATQPSFENPVSDMQPTAESEMVQRAGDGKGVVNVINVNVNVSSPSDVVEKQVNVDVSGAPAVPEISRRVPEAGAETSPDQLADILKEAASFEDGEAGGTLENMVSGEPTEKRDRSISAPAAPDAIERKVRSVPSPEASENNLPTGAEPETGVDAQPLDLAEFADITEPDSADISTTEPVREKPATPDKPLASPAAPDAASPAKPEPDAGDSQADEGAPEEEIMPSEADSGSPQKSGLDMQAALPESPPDESVAPISPVPLGDGLALPAGPDETGEAAAVGDEDDSEDAGGWDTLLQTAEEQKGSPAESYGSGLRAISENVDNLYGEPGGADDGDYPASSGGDGGLGDLSDILKQGTAGVFGGEDWEEELPPVQLAPQEEVEADEPPKPKLTFAETMKIVGKKLKKSGKSIAGVVGKKVLWAENWRTYLLVVSAVLLTVCLALWSSWFFVRNK